MSKYDRSVTYECGCEAGGALVSLHCPIHGDRIAERKAEPEATDPDPQWTATMENICEVITFFLILIVGLYLARYVVLNGDIFPVSP
jgi:hypothetical protein